MGGHFQYTMDQDCSTQETMALLLSGYNQHIQVLCTAFSQVVPNIPECSINGPSEYIDEIGRKQVTEYTFSYFWKQSYFVDVTVRIVTRDELNCIFLRIVGTRRGNDPPCYTFQFAGRTGSFTIGDRSLGIYWNHQGDVFSDGEKCTYYLCKVERLIARYPEYCQVTVSASSEI